MESRRSFLRQGGTVLASLTGLHPLCSAEATSPVNDGRVSFIMECSFVLMELRWFGEHFLPVLTAPPRPRHEAGAPPLIRFADKLKDRTTRQQWQAAARGLMRTVPRHSGKDYPPLDPKEFLPLYAASWPGDTSLLDRQRHPPYTVDGWRIAWDIRLGLCGMAIAEPGSRAYALASLANNHFAAIGPLLRLPDVHGNALQNGFIAEVLFAVLFHKVQVLRGLSRG
jgi:hypothetical protein